MASILSMYVFNLSQAIQEAMQITIWHLEYRVYGQSSSQAAQIAGNSFVCQLSVTGVVALCKAKHC